MTLTEELSVIVGRAFEAAGFDAAYGAVRVSDRPDLAQFQCNGALAAAKKAKQNPRALGEQVAQSLLDETIFASADVAGPGFINLVLKDDFLSAKVDHIASDARCGGWAKPNPGKVVMDYGGPNVAKPLHVGHLRSAIIGEALKRIMRFSGDDVVSDIHLGDWGLQMGQIISELELREPDLPYFDPAFSGPYPETAPIELNDLEEMYPAASAACKEDPARAELARIATKALQDGRPGYRALWRHFVDLSVTAMRANYADLGVSFDLWKGESDADALTPEMVSDLEAKGLVELSDGAKIIRVAREADKKEVPPLILVNSQGAVGYHATDIATILDRKRSEDPDEILYVVDNRQSLHFEQVFRAAAAADYFQEERLQHLGFGTMQGKDGKPFKTRAGGLIKLRDLIDMVTNEAMGRLHENQGEGVSMQTAHQVGVAALKFADLSNQRTADYVFDLERFVTFEGKTGPYLQYAVVRVNSLLEKAGGEAGRSPGKICISSDAERNLALSLLAFGDAQKLTYFKRMPHFLCDHAYTVAQNFSKFYAACRIIDEPDMDLRASRLKLARAAGDQLALVLDLLGMESPARM